MEEINSQSRDASNREFARTHAGKSGFIEANEELEEIDDCEDEENGWNQLEDKERGREEREEMEEEEMDEDEDEQEDLGEQNDWGEEEMEESSEEDETDEDGENKDEDEGVFSIEVETEETRPVPANLHFGEATFEVESEDEEAWVKGFQAVFEANNAECQPGTRASKTKPYERTDKSPELTGRRTISELMNPDLPMKAGSSKKVETSKGKRKAREIQEQAPKDIEMKEGEKERRSTTRINTTEVQKSTNAEAILERIADALIQLTIRELTSISKVASDYLAKKTKVTANNTKEKMLGVCEDVVIKIGGLELTFTLLHPGNFSILLGQPWIDRVRGEYYWVGDKKRFRLRTEDGVYCTTG